MLTTAQIAQVQSLLASYGHTVTAAEAQRLAELIRSK